MYRHRRGISYVLWSPVIQEDVEAKKPSRRREVALAKMLKKAKAAVSFDYDPKNDFCHMCESRIEPMTALHVSPLVFVSVSPGCASALHVLQQLYINVKCRELEGLARKEALAKPQGTPEEHPWCELRHHLSRLISYRTSAYVIAMGFKKWRQLIDNTEIKAIPSSKPGPNPFRMVHPYGSDDSMGPIEAPTALELIGDLDWPQSDILKIKQLAENLPLHEVDDQIRATVNNKKFRPIVHAEVTILQWLETTGGMDESRFFGGERYIASSKPTCRLCHYYFMAHYSGVEVRDSHRNLYPQWLFPDVPEQQGRERILNHMRACLQDDVYRLLHDWRPERKFHDTETNISGPRYAESFMMAAGAPPLDVPSIFGAFDRPRMVVNGVTLDEPIHRYMDPQDQSPLPVEA